MICNCITCGKETNKKPFYIRKFKGNIYCSMDCYHTKLKERFPEQQSLCLQCNKLFKIHPSDKTYNRGKFCNKACKNLYQRQNNHWRWHDASTEAEKQRGTIEYRAWRIAIFIRDNRTCVWCGSKNNIQADHIKPRYLFPELIYDIDNGRTLCHECHKKTPSYGNGYLKREDFIDGARFKQLR